MKPRWITLLASLFLLSYSLYVGQLRRHQMTRQTPLVEEPLYTGKEALRKIRLYFPAADKPGFVSEEREIYQTPALERQLRQVLLALAQGPQSPKAVPSLPKGWQLLEVFAAKDGLCVIDLDPASVAAHPGGTSAEYISLYTLTRAVLDNFRELRAVRFLVGGQPFDTLKGHLDISRPLTLADF